MKLVTSILLLLSYQTLAMDKVVYGVDNRKEVFEAPVFLADLARSTAAMMTKGRLKKTGNGTFKISHNPNIGTSFALCEDARFYHQPTSSDCSGFLIGPDLIATAGHCIRETRDCTSSYWVFDYKVEHDGSVKSEVSADNVYLCKEVVVTKLDSTTKADFALVRLERAVTNRKPLSYRREGSVDPKTELVAIGHPSGLPTKIADRGSVRTNDNPLFFQANLDTFVGNSGSVVLDARTGLVEGILVRGEKDYELDSERGCNMPKVCAEGQCRGEDVSRIRNLLPFLSL